jgi:hypothetical protein
MIFRLIGNPTLQLAEISTLRISPLPSVESPDYGISDFLGSPTCPTFLSFCLATAFIALGLGLSSLTKCRVSGLRYLG